MKKFILGLILLVFLSCEGTQVFGQNTFVVVNQPSIPGYYFPVAFHWDDSGIRKWAAANDKARQEKRIRLARKLAAERKRLKEIKEELYSTK